MVRIKDMKEAYDLVKEKKITLEMCPTSNVQTKAIDDFYNYPFYDFYKDNIKVCINTDNRTVSNINLTNEISLISNEFKISLDDYNKIYKNSIEASFADKSTKIWLSSFIKK